MTCQDELVQLFDIETDPEGLTDPSISKADIAAVMLAEIKANLGKETNRILNLDIFKSFG